MSLRKSKSQRISVLFFSGEGDNIRVYVRVRPPDKHLETDLDAIPCLEVTSGNTVVLQSKPDPKSFSFDHVADINATQVFIICFTHSSSLLLGWSIRPHL